MEEEEVTVSNILKSKLFKYFKIIIWSFIVPMWVALIVNEGAVLLKVVHWLNLEIDFWTIKRFYSITLILALFPLIYIYWFYLESIKKVLLKIHEDHIKHWNKELGVLITENLIKVKKEDKVKGKGDNIDFILIYVNEKLSKLPGILQKIIRKLIDKIPIIEFVNAFDMTALNNENRESIANGFEEKLNSFGLDLINSSVPFWTRLIIPINIVILILYSRL